MSLQTDIQAYFVESITSTGLDLESNFIVWINDGYRDLVGHLPISELDIIKTTGHTSLANDRFLYATENGKVCRQLPSSVASDLTEPYSPQYATSYDPACYITGNTVNVVPGTGTIVIYVIGATGLTSLTGNEIGLLNHFLKSLVLKYAVYQGKKYLSYKSLKEVKDENALITTSISTFLSHIPDTLVIISDLEADQTCNISGIDDTFDYTPPVQPNLEVVEDIDSEIATTLEELNEIAGLDVNDILSEMPVPPVFSTPTQPTLESFPSYIPPTMDDLPSEVTIETVTLPTVPIPSTLPNPVSLKEIILPVAPTIDSASATDTSSFTDFDTHLDGHDTELAQIEALKQKDLLQKYATDVQKGVSFGQAEIQKFQTESNSIIQDVTQSNNAKMQEFQTNVNATISEFQANISAYQTEATTKVQKTGQYNSSILNDFKTKTDSVLGKFQSDLKASGDAFLNDFNATAKGNEQLLSLYQADLNSSVEEFRGELQVFAAKAKQVVDKSGVNISIQQSNIKKIVDEIQLRLSTWKTKADIVAGKNRDAVQLYTAKVQETVQGLQAQVQIFSTKISSVINKFSAENQANLGIYKTNIDGQVQEMQANLQRAKLYIEEASVRLNKNQSLMGLAKLQLEEALALYREYDKELKEYLHIPIGDKK